MQGARVIGSLLGGICLVLLTALTGHSDAIDPRTIQDNAAVPVFASAGPGVVGQTFVSHYPRLHAIQVRWIVPADFVSSPRATITLHLRENPAASTDLAAAIIGLDEVRNNAFSKFVFAPIQNSRARSLYFLLDLGEVESDALGFWSSAGDDYPDGQLFLNGVAADRDLVFRAYYEPDAPLVLGALQDAFARFGWGLAVALFVFVVIGLAVIWIGDLPLIAAATLAMGAGLAILSALSLLLLFLPMPGTLAISATLGVVLIVALARAFFAVKRASVRFDWLAAMLGAVALLAAMVGLAQIRDLPVPLWIDSGTHAESIRHLLEQGRLPASQFYHMGFQAATAALVRLAGLAIPQAMLLMGPLLIVQTGLSVFALSRRLSASALAGLVAAAGIWFLSPTPSYFTTWGRYPLLLGGALLPLALFFAVEWLDAPRFDARRFSLALVTFGGLAFAHVRLTVFYIVFVVVYALLCSTQHQRGRRLARVGLVGAIGLLFGILWLALLTLRGLSWQVILQGPTAPIPIDISTATAVVLSHHGPVFYLLAALAAVVAIVRRTRVARVALAWYASLGLISLSPLNRALITADLVILMGYLPAALIIGDAAHHLTEWMKSAAARIIWAAAIAITVILGARDVVSVVNPATVLFTDADAAAITWIRANTRADAKFLVNSFLWTDKDFVPSDGGMWIPYSAGRSIDYAHSSQPNVEQEIAGRGIDYIYLGRRAGVLTRADFACQPDRYMLVYREDGIDIYRVKR
ncbi:MAG: hypothetical protein HY782_12285 [Chloroflexi bacterium]|nr:hypothetical protein [Chloroflexota bacterium]